MGEFSLWRQQPAAHNPLSCSALRECLPALSSLPEAGAPGEALTCCLILRTGPQDETVWAVDSILGLNLTMRPGAALLPLGHTLCTMRVCVGNLGSFFSLLPLLRCEDWAEGKPARCLLSLSPRSCLRWGAGKEWTGDEKSWPGRACPSVPVHLRHPADYRVSIQDQTL